MEKIDVGTVRKEFADTLNRSAYGKERIVVSRRGKGMAAIVPLEDLEVLERLEDSLDLLAAKESLAEPGENIPLDEVRRRLGL